MPCVACAISRTARTPFGMSFVGTRLSWSCEWRSNVPSPTVVNVVPSVDTCSV